MRQRKPQTDYEAFSGESTVQRRLLRQEELILAITEIISEIMQEDEVSRTELAGRLGRSKGFVTQILAGDRNLTLRTISDVFDALGYLPAVEALRDRFTELEQGTELATSWWKGAGFPQFKVIECQPATHKNARAPEAGAA